MTVRRLVDVLVASAGLVALLPLMTIIAALALMFDGAPVLFRQDRATLGCCAFRIVKFRTMSDARGADGAFLPDGDRVTAIGRFLRRSRLDELPQLWNVLTGAMSLIGPRPLLPETIAAAGDVGVQRCTIAPGLTGWAQVNGNTRLSEVDKFALDLWYIAQRSLALDLQIIGRTIQLVAIGERPDQPAIRRAYEGDRRRGG
jgi:lipopolysaccharide/colanic/teichoic acid biosynthesis glycosyltransferase